LKEVKETRSMKRINQLGMRFYFSVILEKCFGIRGRDAGGVLGVQQQVKETGTNSKFKSLYASVSSS